jgi:hypothetical protein
MHCLTRISGISFHSFNRLCVMLVFLIVLRVQEVKVLEERLIIGGLGECLSPLLAHKQR